MIERQTARPTVGERPLFDRIPFAASPRALAPLRARGASFVNVVPAEITCVCIVFCLLPARL